MGLVYGISIGSVCKISCRISVKDQCVGLVCRIGV